MRRKITETDQEVESTPSGLPELTESQKAFVDGLLSGKTASDAYRAAYDASGMQAQTIWAAASRLRSNGKVAAWLSVARKSELGSSVRTLDAHIKRLERLQEIAIDSGNVGAAVQCEQLIGKASGHYIERYSNVTESDPMNVLAELHKESPEMAAQLAKEHGIPWPPQQSATQH